MRVAFLVPNLALRGGVAVVVGHVLRLRADHGVDAQLVMARRERAADWTHAGGGGVPVITLDQASQQAWDVGVATWWETTIALDALGAARSAYFVQSMEDRFYPSGSPQRAAAAMTHVLPVATITEARWIADQLAAVRGRRAGATYYVRNGIDKAVFGPVAHAPVALDGPLRITVEGSPADALKGVGDALAAVAQMRQPRQVTLVTPDAEAATGLTGVDRVVGPLDQREMAALYDETDVVLKLSRVEGMSGPPLEGFHRGATCVISPVTGHEEYVVDGENGMVVSWDDPRGTARALDLLAGDRRQLTRLRRNALSTARAWPSREQSSAMMALALRRIAAAPDPDPTRATGRIVAESRAAMEVQRAELRDYERLQSRMAGIERVLDRPALRTLRRLATALLHRGGR